MDARSRELIAANAELDDNVLLRPAEACDWLGVGRSTLFELIAEGSLPSVKIGRSRRVPVGVLRNYVRQLVAS